MSVLVFLDGFYPNANIFIYIYEKLLSLQLMRNTFPLVYKEAGSDAGHNNICFI